LLNIGLLKRECRICVSTYNATTFLETLAENIPTLIFWEPCFGRLRREAMSCFETLRSAGIFHESPEHAAHQLNLIWENTEAWWSSEPVQSARLVAIENFAKINENKVSDLSDLLCSLSCSDGSSG
jgi:putative transferase (TIGR04331 family)